MEQYDTMKNSKLTLGYSLEEWDNAIILNLWTWQHKDKI